MITAKAFLFLALALPSAAAQTPAPAPAWLPAGYAFKSVATLPYRGKKILHYRYSDGAHVLSLFQCPPRLRLDFGAKEREKVRVAGGKGFFSKNGQGNVLGWSVKGARLVLIGPLSLDELKKVAESIR